MTLLKYLVNDIRDFFNAFSNSLTLKLEEIYLLDMKNEIKQAFYMQTQMKYLNFIIEVDEKIPVYFWADK